MMHCRSLLYCDGLAIFDGAGVDVLLNMHQYKPSNLLGMHPSWGRLSEQTQSCCCGHTCKVTSHRARCQQL